MSNKSVPQTYRGIIEQVMDNVLEDFHEMGIEEAVMSELQRSWESKVVATGVAEFWTDDRLGQYPSPKQLIKPDPDSRGSTSASNFRNEAEADVKPVLDALGEPLSGGQRRKSGKKPKERAPDDEDLGSDLDDEDEEELNNEEVEADMGGDIIIALYDKVSRIKNKWKITLKDGLVSVNGKDYIFSKCQGEFEW